MPIYLNVEAKFHGEPARSALRGYGVEDPKLVSAVWDLDNTDPEHIKLGIMPGREVVDGLGAMFHLAMISGHKVSTSANGVAFTAEPLEWSKKADTERTIRLIPRANPFEGYDPLGHR